MSLNTVISWIMVCFLILGAADYLLDNKFGLGKEFENGIMASGRLMLCMSGFMILSPLIAETLGPVITPFFQSFGADPSVLAGMLLANDAGGATLAMQLADTEQAGQFSGLIVGSMLGTTVMFGIPTAMAYATKEERPTVIYGLLCGITTIPLGCIAGGFAAGFPASLVLLNTLPVLVISVILFGSLLVFKDKVVPVFAVIGKLLVTIAIFGLACGAVEQMTGFKMFANMDTLDTVFPVVGGISIFLAGAFSLLAVIRRIFAAALTRAGNVLQINNTSVSGLLMSLANGIPPIMMMHEMDDKGRILNIAFLSSVSCIFGDHLAYTSQIAPELCTPVIIGKAVGGLTAFAVALFLAPKLLKKPKNSEKSKK